MMMCHITLGLHNIHVDFFNCKLPIPNLKNISSIVVPLQGGGFNWGIKLFN